MASVYDLEPQLQGGFVTAVSRDATHGFSKANQDRIRLLTGLGVEGDAHLGETVKHRSRWRQSQEPNLRQVYLIHAELFDELRVAGFRVSAGRMKVLVILGACLLASACTSAERAARRQAPEGPAAAPLARAARLPVEGRDAWSEPAREVLVQHCGRCHRGDLATAVPAALAVFDLTDDLWYLTVRADQLDGLLRRVGASEGVEASDLAVMEEFVRCGRDGGCAASPTD